MLLLTERQAQSTTLFGSDPSQTYAPSQGAIYLYQDAYCKDPLSNTATPLMLGQCQNMPFTGIQAVSIASPPKCDNNGTPILIVTNQPDCMNSTDGSGGDSGVVGKCQSYSTGVDIGSVKLVCFGSGASSVTNHLSSATSTDTSQAAYTQGGGSNEGQSNSGGGSDDDDDSCICCCCCTIM